MSLAPDSSSQKFPFRFFVSFVILALAIVGIINVMLATRWGAGTSPDSVVYIAGARNLATGIGFSTISENGVATPITHHAPFYSIILAILNVFGLDPIQGARWLNALLFSGIIVLVGFILRELLYDPADKTNLTPLFGAAFVLASAALLEIHIMLWTEALFLLLSLLGFWILSRFLDGMGYSFLIRSAILIAMAMLTRYIGVVLVATGGLSILMFSRRPFRSRLLDAIVFGIIASIPMVFWLLRNVVLRGTAANREVFYHPITRHQIGWGITTLGSWLSIPDSAPGLVKMLPYVVFGAAFLALVIFKQKRSASGNQISSWVSLSSLPSFIRIIIIFIPLYLGFLLFSLTFLDANIPLDSRILSPVLVPLVILVLYSATEGMKMLGQKAAPRFVLAAAGCLLLVALVAPTVDLVRNSYDNGIGFTSRTWRESPTMAALQDFPSGRVIYTNAPEAFYLYANRHTRPMPKKFDNANQQQNIDYKNELLAVRQELQESDGVVVYFNSQMWPTLPSAQEILNSLGLEVLEQTADGVIYGMKRAGFDEPPRSEINGWIFNCIHS